MERKREAGYGVIDGKLIPKKDIVAGKRNSGDSHWEYNEAISYTTKCNDALEEYHKKFLEKLQERRKLKGIASKPIE